MNLAKRLSSYNKIIVTGPPRTGTTICSRILAHELKYRFVDETFYNGNDQAKFGLILHHPRKFVIQMTAFTRDIHTYYFSQPTCIVLMIRPIKDILESMLNSTKFIDNNSGFNIEAYGKIFKGLNNEAVKIIKKHFGYENSKLTLPEVIYDHFNNHRDPTKNYMEVNYEDLKKHKLFIEKKVRRKNFVHIKQIDLDPEYIHRRGVLML